MSNDTNTNAGKSYFERPVYDKDGNVMGFNHEGDSLPEGGSLVSPRPEKDPMKSNEEIAEVRKNMRISDPSLVTSGGDVTPAPAPKKRGRPRKVVSDLKNQSLTVKKEKGERKPRVSKRSIILKGMDSDTKKKTVVEALEAKLGKLNFVTEEKHEFAQINYGGKDLFVKFKKIEKGNPDRSLMVSIYPADFRGKKIKPVSRGYEKKGALFMSRIFDKLDKFVAK